MPFVFEDETEVEPKPESKQPRFVFEDTSTETSSPLLNKKQNLPDFQTQAVNKFVFEDEAPVSPGAPHGASGIWEKPGIVDKAADITSRYITRPLMTAKESIKESAGGILQSVGESMADVRSPAQQISERYGFELPEDMPVLKKPVTPKFITKTGEAIAAKGKDIVSEAREKIQSLAPEEDASFAEKTAFKVLHNIGLNAPGLALSIITKKPIAGLGFLGGVSYGGKYAAEKERGASIDEAHTRALGEAGSEGFTELIPISILLKPGLSLAKRIAYNLISELVGENVNTAYSLMQDKANYEPDKPFGDFITQDLMPAFADTSIVAGLSSLVMGAAAHPFGRKTAKGLRIEESAKREIPEFEVENVEPSGKAGIPPIPLPQTPREKVKEAVLEILKETIEKQPDIATEKPIITQQPKETIVSEEAKGQEATKEIEDMTESEYNQHIEDSGLPRKMFLTYSELQLAKKGEQDAKRLREDAGRISEGRDVEEVGTEESRKDLELKTQGAGISRKGKKIKPVPRGEGLAGTFQELGEIKGAHLGKTSTGTYWFLGRPDARLALQMPDGSDVPDNILKERQRSSFPAMIDKEYGIKLRLWKTPQEAIEYAKSRGLESTIANIDKFKPGEAPTAPAQIQPTEVIQKPSPVIQTRKDLAEQMKIAQPALSNKAIETNIQLMIDAPAKVLDMTPDEFIQTYIESIQKSTLAELEGKRNEVLYQSKEIADEFYSHLEDIIEKSSQSKYKPEQLLNYLKAQGVKDAEIETTGLHDYLKGKENINKDELLEYIKGNQVEVEIKEYADKNIKIFNKRSEVVPIYEAGKTVYGYDSEGSWHDEPGWYKIEKPEELNRYSEFQITELKPMTKYSQWVEPGGENYREILLTLPVEESIAARQDMNAELFPERYNIYKSSHFNEPNIIVHIRINDRTDANGKKVLFIEEIQSERAADLKRGKVGVPQFPFSKTWHELALRYILRYASENGYDSIAWTTGEMQQNRYDLSKHIEKLEYVKNLRDEYVVTYLTKDGKEGLITNTTLKPDELSQYIGKDATDKILKSGKEKGTLSGLDLKIGGEWAKRFYDEMIPQYLNKYAKKWGGKTKNIIFKRNIIGEDIKLIERSEDYEVVWYDEKGEPLSFERFKNRDDAIDFMESLRRDFKAQSLDITPSMRQSVLYEGQPLFQGKKGAIEFLPNGKAIIHILENADKSTFLHEMFHLYVNMMQTIPKLKPQLKILETWIGKPIENWTVNDYEKAAKGGEKYLWEGNAPTSALKAVFEQFKKWLREIYKTAKSLDVKLSDDVRKMWDEWFGKRIENIGKEPTKITQEVKADVPSVQTVTGLPEKASPVIQTRKDFAEVEVSQNIYQQIKQYVGNKIKTDKSFYDHFGKEEATEIIRKNLSMFSKDSGLPMDEVADSLNITTDELADKMRNTIGKKEQTEKVSKEITREEFEKSMAIQELPKVIVGDLGLKVGDKFKILGEQYSVKEKDAEGNFIIEDGDKYIVDEFSTIPQPDEGSIIKGKVKYSQPKLLEGEKADIKPQMETEIQGQQKLFGKKGEIVKELESTKNLKVGQTFLPDLGEIPLREYGFIESVTTKPEVITPERLEAAISTGIPENTDRVFSWSEIENYIIAKMSIQKIGKSAISKVGDINYGKQIITALKNKTAIIKYEMSRKYSKEESINKYNYEYLFNPYSFMSTRDIVGKKTPKIPGSFINSMITEMKNQGIIKEVTPGQPFYGERRFLIDFNKDFEIPQKALEESKKVGIADIGGYSELAQGKTEEGEAPPPKETPPGIPKPEDLEKYDLPELVELAKGLLNEYPELKNNLGKALGAFYPGQGLIKLRRDLAKDHKLAELVLAHEIGHGGVDWLPEKTLERGNVLGRIASFRNYLETLLKEYPRSPHEILTNEDRERFRSQAIELAKQELKNKQIGGLEVLPQQILEIWNDIQGKEKNPILYDYIVKLSEQEKKQILLDALKGKVEFKLFDPSQEGFESLDEKTKELYRKLVKEEIIKRKLYEEEVIREELKKLTQVWKPFNEKTNESFTKYRYSGKELYADAISVLLNNPKLLADTAPNFYKAFFSYIENKPDFRDLYYSITSQYKKGTIAEHRAELSALMTKGGEKAFALPVQSKAERTFMERISNAAGEIKKEFVDKFSPLYDSIKSNEIRKRVRNSVEDFIYKESEKQAYMNEIYENGGLKDVQDNKISETGVADYVKARRIIHERGEIFNPGGHNPATAQTLLDNLKAKLGVEKYKILEDSIEKFWNVRKAYIIARMKESRMYDEELMKKIEENKYYVTFDHTEDIEKRFGKRITARIYKQVGSLKEIANPYTATILKDMAILDSINFNTAKRESLEGLKKDNYPDILIPETTKQRTPSGWVTVFKESADPRSELVTWLENGKVNGYYIPRNIADAFDKSPIDTWRVVKVLNKISQPYREIFTRKRPGFALFNIIRDPQAAMMILPGANVHNFPYLMAKAIVPAIKGQHGFEAKTQRLLRGKALLTTVDTSGMTPEDTQLERLMIYYGLKYPAKNNLVYRSIERLGAWLNYLGDTSERVTKIAVADYLDKHYPGMPDADKMHLVRWAGSPAFLVGGEAKQLINNILLFANPQIQGWRIQGEAAKERPLEFALKTVQFAIIPKILMALGLAGYFDEIKDIYTRVSPYGLTNYTVIPIMLTPSGKAVSLYIPQSETNRFIGGIFWKLLTDTKKPSDILELLDYTAGQFPGLNPGIGLMVGLMQLLTGQKVYDSFRQKYAIPEEIREAKDWRTAGAYFKYFWNQQGLGVVHKFDTDNIGDIKKGIDKLINYPLSSDILGRFIRVEDSGLTSRLYESAEPAKTVEARYRLDLKEAINNVINEKPIDEWNENQRDAWNYLLSKDTDKEIVNRVSRAIGKSKGMALERVLLSATSKAQKEAIVKKYLELEGTTEE